MSAQFTVIVGAPTTEEINQAMIEHLQGHGYQLSAPNEQLERPGEFLERIGRPHNLPLRATIREWRRRGGTVLTQEGMSGRVIELLSNPAFDAFCRRNKR